MFTEAYPKSKIGPLAFVIKINSLEQVCLENDSNMVVIYMNVSQHSSGDQIGNMQEQLNSVTEWLKDQDMILNR